MFPDQAFLPVPPHGPADRSHSPLRQIRQHFVVEPLPRRPSLDTHHERRQQHGVRSIYLLPSTDEPTVSDLEDPRPDRRLLRTAGSLSIFFETVEREVGSIGLCGSGLLDAVAQLRLSGLLMPSGRFIKSKQAAQHYSPNL